MFKTIRYFFCWGDSFPMDTLKGVCIIPLELHSADLLSWLWWTHRHALLPYLWRTSTLMTEYCQWIKTGGEYVFFSESVIIRLVEQVIILLCNIDLSIQKYKIMLQQWFLFKVYTVKLISASKLKLVGNMTFFLGCNHNFSWKGGNSHKKYLNCLVYTDQIYLNKINSVETHHHLICRGCIRLIKGGDVNAWYKSCHITYGICTLEMNNAF